MRSPLDYSGPQAALAWFVLLSVLVGLICIGWWVLDRLEQWVTRAEPEPEPEPVDPRDLCSDLACRRAATKAIHGYGLCDKHHAAIRAHREVS